MTELFEVKPSHTISIYIVAIHLCGLILILLFQIPPAVCVAGVILLAFSLLDGVKRYLSRSHYWLKYEPIYKYWAISIDGKVWRRYQDLRVVCLNDALVWIILSSAGQSQSAVMIGVDCMLNERFLQLRRCILCPDAFVV